MSSLMTRTIIGRLKFPRITEKAMADKSRSDKLRAKGLGGITLGDVAFTFIDRRQKTPTAVGYLTLIFLGYLIVSSIRHRSAERVTEDDIEINPKFLPGVGKKEDPQEAEFKRILVENQKLDKPKLPVFNANKHRDDLPAAQLQKKRSDLERYGYPKPKEFPVNVIARPNINCPGDATLLLMIVSSRPDNGGARNSIRATWGTHSAERFPTIPTEKWRTIFVMGKSDYDVFDTSVLSEADTHHDMLVGEFHDTPHEDTRKFMLAMKWIHENIQGCKFNYVLKTKDDIYHNMVSISNWLEAKYKKDGTDDIYVGKLLRLDRPIRDTRDPLHVPETDYSKEFFPNIIHGPVYLFRKTTYHKLADQMSRVTPIAMEDGYVGLLAEKAAVKPTHNDHYQLLGKTNNVCHQLRMFFISPILPSEHVTIFKKIKMARVSGECKGAMWVDEDGHHEVIDV